MNKTFTVLAALVFALTAFSVAADRSAIPATSQSPRVFLLDANGLKTLRQRVSAGNFKDPAVDKLRREADKYLKMEPVSITTKQATPPSGDKHDYMSLAPYFWPDPTKPNGLPYIRRDGERNPEADKTQDEKLCNQMITSSRTLALAYYVFQDEKYAAQAAKILRAWFLDPATKMNPNLQFAQAIRGKNDGRGSGLIETHRLPYAIDAIGLLAGSKSWTDADQKGVQDWFANYLKWMTTSDGGRHESDARNNHGSYYDGQIISIALFLGDSDLATKTVKSETKRIVFQIQKDGKQPLELERTRALHYSTFNIEALFQLATLGQNVGVDLWNYQGKDGASVRKALDFLVPYVTNEKPWPYKQINTYNTALFSPLLMAASIKYQEPQYEQLAVKIDPSITQSIDLLVAKLGQKQ